MPNLPPGVTQSPRNQRGIVTFLLSGPPGARVMRVDMPITPDEIDIQRPSRQQVSQTLGGAYQDHLGAGVTTMRLSGHTGWRGNASYADGYAALIALRDIFGDYDRRVAQNNPDDVAFVCLLDIPKGWESFRISKNSTQFQRSKTSPLLFRYSLDLTVLEDFNYPPVDPSPNFVITLASPIPLPPRFLDPDDPPPDIIKTTNVAANLCNSASGPGVTAIVTSGSTTLRQLAAQYYAGLDLRAGSPTLAQGVIGISAGDLWPYIAWANQDYFPPGKVSGGTLVPTPIGPGLTDHDFQITLCIPALDFPLDPDYLIRNMIGVLLGSITGGNDILGGQTGGGDSLGGQTGSRGLGGQTGTKGLGGVTVTPGLGQKITLGDTGNPATDGGSTSLGSPGRVL